MGIQYLEIAGEQMAVLPAAELKRLLAIAEEKEDISAAVEAESKRDAGMEYLPSSMVDRIIDGDNALRVWREYREYSVAQLAEKSGYGTSMISKLERGTRQGTVAMWKALALALEVAPEHIMPLD